MTALWRINHLKPAFLAAVCAAALLTSAGIPEAAADGGTAPLSAAPALAGKAAVHKAAYSAADKERYDTLRRENQGRLAPKERFITTTAPAIIVTFGGLTRRQSVDDMLSYLEGKGVTATFFVTELELRKYGDTIRDIVDHGHELGLGLRTGTTGDYYETCAQIERLERNLSRRFGVRPAFARQIFGKPSPEVEEACSAMGIRLIGQTVNTVQTKDKAAKTPEDIFSHLFGAKVYSMGRGQIIYTRLDFLDNPVMTSDVLDLIKRNKIDNIAYRTPTDSPEKNPANDSSYYMTSLGKVLEDRSHLWAYPVDVSAVPWDLRPENRGVQVNKRNFEEQFAKRYIGSPMVKDRDNIRGFSKSEIRQMDRSGRIHGVKDRTIFLTFDDWGTDDSINKLMYVLRKHHAQGTFFVITWNVKNNPNLLRALAEEGNSIGSHTNRHRALVAQTGDYGTTLPMTDEEYEKDISSAYEKLALTVGDVKAGGKPALTRLFRPPTLAISKKGAMEIMNAGYTYMVAGYDSTHDYAAPGVQAVVGAINNGIYDENGEVRSGTIMVMHMTETARYTAEALDDVLTVNDARADDDPKKFRIGRLDDYLRDDYSQKDDEDQIIHSVKGLVYKGNCCG